MSSSSMKMSPGNIDLFGKGTLVEATSDEEWFSGGWFVAKILDPSPTTPGEMKFLVEYQSLLCHETLDGRELLRKHVDVKLVRPLRPPLPNDDKQQRFEVIDVVDAYYNDGWWVGVVSKVWGEDKQRVYSVLLENPSRIMNFRSSELRFHLDWVGDKWIQPQKHNKVSSKGGEKRGKQIEAETSGEKRKRGKHVKFLLKECGGDEGCVVKIDAEDSSTTGAGTLDSKSYENHNILSLECSPVLIGKECGGAEGSVDKIIVEDSSTIEAAVVDNMPYENENLRSLESSPVLKFVQSLEEFQLMPQKPHFCPLDECEEVFREGRVLQHMMTFVNVVKETSKLQVNASGSMMDVLLKCLPELESHSFDVKDVRSRLLKMRSMKKGREHLQAKLEKVKSEIKIRTHEGTKINAELIDAIEEIKVLEEKKARIISMHEENDSEMAKLKSSDSLLNEIIQNVEHNFASLATFPWR